jgi:hypothetical protein
MLPWGPAATVDLLSVLSCCDVATRTTIEISDEAYSIAIAME